MGNNTVVAYRIPQEKFIPLYLFYMLPREIAAQANLLDFPRTPHMLFKSKQWIDVYMSDYFKLVLSDSYAYLLWPHFGIPGGLECYTGYDPFWKLAHNTNLISEAINDSATPFVKMIVQNPRFEWEWLTIEDVQPFLSQLMDAIRRFYPFEEMKKTILNHRAPEDYDARYSNVKIDFWRKWNHSRTKHPTSVLSSVYMNDDGDSEIFAHDPMAVADDRIMVEQFVERLDQNDRDILRLLMQGYSKTEIAARLGYANHSAVSKRAAKIKERYREYVHADDEFLSKPYEAKKTEKLIINI